MERKSEGKRPIPSGTSETLSLLELSGYNSKRQEFDIEYDNNAEQLLAEMEFKDSDTEEERELKLRVVRIYNERLDERQRRKKFILKRNLLQPSPFKRGLSAEERAICRRYDVFMRFHSKEEHEELHKTVVEEHRILKRIEDLKEARAAGCRTSAEAERYLEIKRRPQEASRSTQNGSNVSMASERPAAGGQASSSSHVHDLDIMRFAQVQLLSEAEKSLCTEVKLPPPLYLKMQEVISRGISSGNIKKKGDAHRFFYINQSIIDRVYDMVVKKWLAPSP